MSGNPPGVVSTDSIEISAVPKRNYGYEKRQKELTRQTKREEKRQRKLERTSEQPDETTAEDPAAPSIPEEE